MPQRATQAFLRMLGMGAQLGARRRTERQRAATVVGARRVRIKTAEQRKAEETRAAEGVIRATVKPMRTVAVPEALPSPTKQTFEQWETAGIKRELEGVKRPSLAFEQSAARQRFERRAYAQEELPMAPAVVNVATGQMVPEFGYAPAEETLVQRRERRRAQYAARREEAGVLYASRQQEIASAQQQQQQERERYERDVASAMREHRGGIGLAAIVGKREKAAREAAKPPALSPEQKGVRKAREKAAEQAEETRLRQGEAPTPVRPVRIPEDRKQAFLELSRAGQLSAIETYRQGGRRAYVAAYEALLAGP